VPLKLAVFGFFVKRVSASPAEFFPGYGLAGRIPALWKESGFARFNRIPGKTGVPVSIDTGGVSL